MIARIHKAMNEKDRDKGFTLIELLVVVIIIGILSAIAIPVFLNQRKKAVDAGIKEDLHTVATALETYMTDYQKYPDYAATAQASVVVAETDASSITIGDQTVKLSSGDHITVKTSTDSQTYLITGWNAKGTANTDAKVYSYTSNGGLVAGTAGTPSGLPTS